MSGERIIMHCSCESDFQDKMYGVGMRVHNDMTSKENMARCTVCGTERSISKNTSRENTTENQNNKKKKK